MSMAKDFTWKTNSWSND